MKFSPYKFNIDDIRDNPLTVECVRWTDAAFIQETLHPDEEIMAGVIQESIGFLLNDKGPFVVLVQDRNVDNSGAYRSVLSIPKVNITSRQRLKIKKL